MSAGYFYGDRSFGRRCAGATAAQPINGFRPAVLGGTGEPVWMFVDIRKGLHPRSGDIRSTGWPLPSGPGDFVLSDVELYQAARGIADVIRQESERSRLRCSSVGAAVRKQSTLGRGRNFGQDGWLAI